MTLKESHADVAGGSRSGAVTSVLRWIGPGPGWHLLERNFLLFRRHAWVIIGGFFEPLFYLLSIGVGLSRLVGDVDLPGNVTVSYPAFIAPAMLASSAMNGAVMETTFNVFSKLNYSKTYQTMLSTPLRSRDLAVGDVYWAVARGAVYSSMFVVVMAAFGLFSSWWALLALPAAVLVAFAFASVGLAAMTFMRTRQDLELVPVATLLMFLFSATFFPLGQYPESAQYVVTATPLYQGVALIRSLTTGTVGIEALWHVSYLAIMGLVGLIVATRRLSKRLTR
ncbi:ABC transporter permease [Actinoplanes sp. NPDC020271]|uniref:ABC transporter permease n=1 Tax=Actinoplanes sp. NPDC020271 TaxID=3363896 RepID=UPI0037ADC039